MTRTETGGSRLILSSSMIIIPWVGCKGKKEKLLHGRKKKASRKAVFIVKWPYRVSQTTGRGEDKARGGLAGIIFSHLSTKGIAAKNSKGTCPTGVKGHNLSQRPPLSQRLSAQLPCTCFSWQWWQWTLTLWKWHSSEESHMQVTAAANRSVPPVVSLMTSCVRSGEDFEKSLYNRKRRMSRRVWKWPWFSP